MSASRSTTARCSRSLDKMIKQRREAITQFESGRTRRPGGQGKTAEIAVLQGYLARADERGGDRCADC